MKPTIYGYIVWFISTLFVIYAFCLNTAAAVFQETITHSLNTTHFQTSIAMGAFIAGFACMQIPAGYLLDRLNARYVVSIGVLILAVGNIFISLSHNIVSFSLANLIQGIGASFAFIAAAVLVSQWFSEKSFPIMFGLTQSLSCVLSGVMHSLMADRLTTHSWNSIYQLLGMAGLVLFVFTILFVKSPNNRPASASISLLSSMGTVLKNKQIVLCALAGATSFGALLAYAGLWYMSVQTFYAVSTKEAYFISSLMFIGIGLGTPILGILSNFAKSRMMVIHTTLVLGTIMLLAGIYLPHFNFNNLIMIKSVSFLIGFLLSGSMLFYTVVSEITNFSIRGVALSVLNTGVFLFNAILLFLPYLLINARSPSFFSYLWILPVSVLLSILIVYFIKESYLSSTT
jgi:nitrate/nitrite transporter NarK